MITEPIEGFFIKSKDDLIFDVKGLTHPTDRIIAFVRYVPDVYFKNKNYESTYQKLYVLSERYEFLTKHFPKYIFNDPKGRGLLQAVHKNDLSKIYNPIKKLQEILMTPNSKLDSFEIKVREFVKKINTYCKIPIDNIGISGSILVGLQNNDSDIDLVVYGVKQGKTIYDSMPEIFSKNNDIKRYNQNELEKLWINRGQNNQIDFCSFLQMEQNKHLQGTFDGTDFYIRLIPFPDEFDEHYKDTMITSYGEIEIKAKIKKRSFSIYTPCVYPLKEVSIINKRINNDLLPERIFSVRGRYCDLAKDNTKIHVKGKLEKVTLSKEREFYQVVLGSSSSEFFKISQF